MAVLGIQHPAEITNSSEKKPRSRKDRENGGLQSGVLLKTSKNKETCRILKPKNSFKMTSMFPQSLTEDKILKCCHSRSESFLSTSSSVWDTDCLIAADPKTTKVPSVLIRSARNELDSESDQTDELLQWDPYKGVDLSFSDSNSSDDTLFIPKSGKSIYSKIQVTYKGLSSTLFVLNPDFLLKLK